ncbi:TlpA disulfide reductase family protein [Chitinophaga eiseniae]|uniref:TlpA family protein disulfide reductase n=1 Tax=Chitinophaga eiseniae TaxID=634771 RepID=A0A847SH54_9BACT|nr:TlpA disulfide reductase family protein [Chitinophaga eiseniae]NLR79093.1 TlpA family protein disulfide reductase [Chitinophaga eiseniae]
MKRIIGVFCFLVISWAAVAQNGMEGVRELRAITDSAQLKMKLAELEKGKTEQDLETAYFYYRYAKDGAARAQQVLDRAIKEYPQGQLAFNQEVQPIEELRDLKEIEKQYQALIRKFPGKNSPVILAELVNASAEKGDARKMLEYCNQLDVKKYPSVYASALAALAGSNPREAAPLLKDAVTNSPVTPANISQAKPRAAAIFYSMAGAYGKSLLANGKAEDAYQFLYLLAKDNSALPPRISEVYITALLQTKRYKEALPLITDAIKASTASADLKARLKEVYTIAKGSAAGFETYEQQLLQASDERIAADAVQHAVSLPAADFAIKDVDGNLVSLQDMKGKVVVLDFWATWCGPCKLSFPSMQAAVDKYKNDPDVKFFFIHTLDKTKGDAAKEAKAYVTDNHYSFHVLMDWRNKETDKSPVAQRFNVDAIPAKIVIDPQGNIRFRKIGFDGNNEVAFKELSAMIEYARSK